VIEHLHTIAAWKLAVNEAIKRYKNFLLSAFHLATQECGSEESDRLSGSFWNRVIKLSKSNADLHFDSSCGTVLFLKPIPLWIWL
jgi:hypothetical protein